jgi:hypothetical protein
MKYLTIPKLTKHDIIRFRQFVNCQEFNRCHFWSGSTSKGYGRFKLQGRLFSATRLAYYLAYKIDPNTKHVCHTCDNPRCCNPKHLWLGTSRENTLDSVQKGRYHRKEAALRGEKSKWC